MLQAFDAGSMQTRGDAAPFGDSGPSTAALSYVPVTVSDSGVLLYGQFAGNQMTWFDRTGKHLGSIGPSGILINPSISPNQKSVAFSLDRDIWVRDLERGAEQRLTTSTVGISSQFGIWSPRGDRIVCSVRCADLEASTSIKR